MRLILASGLALFEVLISLFLLSLALLGFDGLLLSALQLNRTTFFAARAEQQMQNLEERLRAQDQSQDLSQTVADWNRENKLLLPQGEGSVTGGYPDYTFSLCWVSRQKDGTCLRETWRGSTLIELMISLSLSLMLLFMATGLYLTMERQNQFLTTLAAEKDKTQFVFQVLKRELQAAGFIGCPHFSDDFPLGNTTSFVLSARNKVRLETASNGSSVITVWHRASRVTGLQENLRQASVLVLSSPLKIKPGAFLLISDCRHADLFQVADVFVHKGLQELRTKQPLQYHYEEQAEIGELEITSYFVKKTGRKARAGQELNAFYSRDREGHLGELVEGVQNLQATFVAAGRGVALELQLTENNLSKAEFAFVALRN